MKIENLLLNNFILDNNEETFKEGYTFKAKILKLVDNLILIDFKGRGAIQAKLETNIKMAVGDEMTFLVKSVDNDEIILKPLVKDKFPETQPSNDGKEKDPISNLLKNISIKETRLSIGLAENLMKYNAPITEQNLTNGIKTLEKLFQLNKLKDDEKVVLINPTTSDKDLILDKTQSIKENVNITIDAKTDNPLLIQDNTLEIENSVIKADLKTFLVISKDDNNQGKDITQIVKEYLGSGIDIDSEDEYVKIISFFLKNGIKPSLNNIKNLKEFNKNPIEFAKDFKLINKMLDKYGNDDKNKIYFDKNEIINIRNIINKNEKLIELQKIIRSFGNTEDIKYIEDIKNISNKIDFLNEMNKDLSFIFLPINHKEKELDGILTLIKGNRKKKNFDERTNIYINVETHNLGNIKISCQLISKSLSIKMNINNRDLELFKLTEKQLIEKISLIGYSLDKIEFVVDNSIQIIDTIVSNPNPTYILDLRA